MGALNLEDLPLKFHFIPYPAPGHMIPLCDIATLFASCGHHVTIITTPSNAQILLKSIPSHHNLHLHTIPFPSHQVGLPPGVENIGCANNLENSYKVHQATKLLQSPIHQFVEQNSPDCIVADSLFLWMDELANKLHIPRLAFNGFSLFAICAMKSLKAHDSMSCIIQGLPHLITLNALPPIALTKFMEPLLEIELKSYGLIVNNFSELDGEEYIEHYEKTTGHRAWHIGPVSLICRTTEEKAERGQTSAVSVHECMSWLNSKQPNSVIYICFGSLCHFSDNQLYEIASAIKASEHQYIWVVPEKKGNEDENEKWLPKAFEQRNKGIIIRGWAPQVVILGHPAIGAFLTHCGWNSTVEAVSAGVPMITWPIHDEQFYNEKLITQVRGIGVEVGVEEWSIIGFMERKKLVGRDIIEKAVRRLMDGGIEADEIRQCAQEYAVKAKRAVQQGGSSHKNLMALIDDLKRLRRYKPLDS
ncbi:probable UDP-glucosyl transferase 73B6 [Cicer arietinum]|uniref:Glycosyltransferase n=1 Tax=Cicer arietinum TaxID=3827 RepID=A0A067XTZ9_CICAR|nr:scopoletin glucosyltransferase [Cicer arietinum]AGU14075.1 UDP-glycosyltransferase [Cicer arietinum]